MHDSEARAGAGKPLIEIDRVGMVYQADSGPVEALRDITLTIGAG